MKKAVAFALALFACAGPSNDTAVVDLYRSRDAFLKRETDAFLASHPVDDLAALEKVWKELGANYPARATKAGPLLPTALVEIARNRAEKLYRASLPYGKASAPKDGVYYLAQAEASRRFADSIAIDGRREPPPDREQIRSALQSLEREAYEQYERDPSRRSLVFSARLKEARELLERDSLAGATLTLLEARRDGSPNARGSVEVTGDTALHGVFRDQPAALSLLDAMTSRTLPVAKTASGPVTVTLIRWPYT